MPDCGFPVSNEWPEEIRHTQMDEKEKRFDLGQDKKIRI